MIYHYYPISYDGRSMPRTGFMDDYGDLIVHIGKNRIVTVDNYGNNHRFF